MAEVRSGKYFNTNNKVHPLKFALWVGMASITMMLGRWSWRRASGGASAAVRRAMTSSTSRSGSERFIGWLV